MQNDTGLQGPSVTAGKDLVPGDCLTAVGPDTKALSMEEYNGELNRITSNSDYTEFFKFDKGCTFAQSSTADSGYVVLIINGFNDQIALAKQVSPEEANAKIIERRTNEGTFYDVICVRPILKQREILISRPLGTQHLRLMEHMLRRLRQSEDDMRAVSFRNTIFVRVSVVPDSENEPDNPSSTAVISCRYDENDWTLACLFATFPVLRSMVVGEFVQYGSPILPTIIRGHYAFVLTVKTVSSCRELLMDMERILNTSISVVACE